MEIEQLSKQQKSPNSVAYCILNYQAEADKPRLLDTKTRMLVALQYANLEIRLFVDPLWMEIIDSQDVPYMKSILGDLALRAAQHGQELFLHLCDLSVGPIVTEDVGSVQEGDPFIENLTKLLVEIEVSRVADPTPQLPLAE